MIVIIILVLSEIKMLLREQELSTTLGDTRKIHVASQNDVRIHRNVSGQRI